MPHLVNPIKKLRRNRNKSDDELVAESRPTPVTSGCCGCVCMGSHGSSKSSRKHQDDDGSVLTADTSITGTSMPNKDDVSPSEDLGYPIGDAAVTLLDGFSAIMKCCYGLIVKPANHSDNRSCCTTITWGPDEVRYMEDVGEEMSLAADEASKSSASFAKTNGGCDQQQERERSPSPEWENFDHFQVNQENIEIWNNDTEEQQRMIEAAFSSDFSDFSSFVAPTDNSIEDVSVKSSNTNASNTSNGKKKRACACCGKSSKKDSHVKLKVCSRCKTTYYCSAGEPTECNVC
jgi:hypothetical protein